MSKRNPLRFKTEAEFIQEFGLDWRNSIPYNWGKQMDNLLGQEVDESKIDRKADEKYPLKDFDFSYKDSANFWPWTISKQMTTRKRLPVILADGTVAKVGMKVRWLDITQVYHPGIIQRLYPLQIVCICISCSKSGDAYPRELNTNRVIKARK